MGVETGGSAEPFRSWTASEVAVRAAIIQVAIDTDEVLGHTFQEELTKEENPMSTSEALVRLAALNASNYAVVGERAQEIEVSLSQERALKSIGGLAIQ